MSEVRRLGQPDREALGTFLERRLDSSLFLLSNMDAAGLDDHGRPLEGTYVGAFTNGELTAAAAHYWNGIVIVQGDAGLEEAARAAVSLSKRALSGLLGPLELVERARLALALGARPVRKDAPEILYAVDLDRLSVPELLGASGIECRAPTDDEIANLLVDWRVSYSVETLGAERTPALETEARESIARLGRQGWVLCHHGRQVAYSTFNASTRGVVQVGGVFTPRELRGRGYGRAVVAASLLDARSQGNQRSVLFTPRDNAPAQRAYRALGYEAIGEFGMVLFG